MPKALTAKGIGAPDFVKELRSSVYTVSSDKDQHFTEALVKNAVERESITGLRSDRVKITRVTIQSTQQLHFQLLFYRTDQFDEADIGDDQYVERIDLNLANYGIQQTTSQWRLDVSTGIEYEDSDKTKELHVVLKNVYPTTKIAGASGELKVDFQCESMA